MQVTIQPNTLKRPHLKMPNEENTRGKNAVSHVNIKVIQSRLKELKLSRARPCSRQQKFAYSYDETGAGMHSMEIDFEVVDACF